MCIAKIGIRQEEAPYPLLTLQRPRSNRRGLEEGHDGIRQLAGLGDPRHPNRQWDGGDRRLWLVHGSLMTGVASPSFPAVLAWTGAGSARSRFLWISRAQRLDGLFVGATAFKTRGRFIREVVRHEQGP